MNNKASDGVVKAAWRGQFLGVIVSLHNARKFDEIVASAPALIEAIATSIVIDDPHWWLFKGGNRCLRALR